MDRLKHKVAIVTGGALGIGEACTRRMVSEGAAVAILDRLEFEAGALASELTRAGHRVSFEPVDVSDEALLRAAIDRVVARYGRLDILVNNAGIAGAPKPTEQVSEAEWDRVQAVNVKGVFFGTKHALPHLRKAGGGSIINLSSIAGLVGLGSTAPYHASKGAVRLMTKNDAITYAADGIRVNSIHPGYIWTPMVRGHFAATGADLEEARAAAGKLHPLGHIGEPDDIAWAVVYLASDESRFVTGSELVVDGGYTAR
jgi:NAD(P)-dependent dehydrogenase (short-subunit alcohol dehydrogenase family)